MAMLNASTTVRRSRSPQLTAHSMLPFTTPGRAFLRRIRPSCFKSFSKPTIRSRARRVHLAAIPGDRHGSVARPPKHHARDTVRAMPPGYMKPGGQPPWLCGLFALAEEDVICGIGDAAKGAGLIARPLGGAAVGVDPLHGGDIRERPASA